MTVAFATMADFRRMERGLRKIERQYVKNRRRNRPRTYSQNNAVKIYTAAEIPPYGCFKYSGFTATARQSKTVAQSTVTGAQSMHGFSVGITLDAANHGWAQPFPPFLALYDTADGTPAAGESWGPINASWKIRKRVGGFVVLGVETIGIEASGSGYVWVVPDPWVVGKGRLDGDLATNSTATVSVYDKDGDTTYNITVADRDEPMIPAAKKLASGVDIEFAWLATHQEWHVINSDTCPVAS